MRFRFLNIPVQIDPTFWIFLLLFTGLYQGFSMENIILSAVLFLSLLTHEYGHALAALYFNASPEITFQAFGGSAKYSDRNLSKKQIFLITLSGPLLESVLIIIPFFLLQSPLITNYYLTYALYACMKINIIWSLFNLIPITPLDGGHLLSFILESLFKKQGKKIAYYIGLLAASIIVPLLAFKGLYFFSILLTLFAWQFYRQNKAPAALVNPFDDYMQGVEALNTHRTEKAKVIFQKLLKTKNEKLKLSALESLAETHMQENHPDLAYTTLLKVDPKRLSSTKSLLANLAFLRKNYTLVALLSREAYLENSTFETALQNAKAFGYLNDPIPAGAWLETAARFEIATQDSLKAIILDPAFNLVRNDPSFCHYLDKISPLIEK